MLACVCFFRVQTGPSRHLLPGGKEKKAFDLANPNSPNSEREEERPLRETDRGKGRSNDGWSSAKTDSGSSRPAAAASPSTG